MRDAARIRCVGDVLYSVVTRGEGVCRRRRPRRAALDFGLSAHGTAERLAMQRRMGSWAAFRVQPARGRYRCLLMLSKQCVGGAEQVGVEVRESKSARAKK